MDEHDEAKGPEVEAVVEAELVTAMAHWLDERVASPSPSPSPSLHCDWACCRCISLTIRRGAGRVRSLFIKLRMTPAYI